MLALALAALALPAPAGGADGAEVRGVIEKVEELRGLRATQPLAVTTLDAAGLRRVVVRLLAQERTRRSDAGWDDALHLLGVLKPGAEPRGGRAARAHGAGRGAVRAARRAGSTCSARADPRRAR